MENNQLKVRISITLSPAIADRLAAYASANGISRSAVVSLAVTEFLREEA